jgi:acyl carrier protein
MAEFLTRTQRTADLLRFLRTIQKPDFPINRLDERANFIKVGLIDSLAVLEIVLYLEETYGIDFAKSGIDPGELNSMTSILDLIERETE